jgi:hypothetical protein
LLNFYLFLSALNNKPAFSIFILLDRKPERHTKNRALFTSNVSVAAQNSHPRRFTRDEGNHVIKAFYVDTRHASGQHTINTGQPGQGVASSHAAGQQHGTHR